MFDLVDQMRLFNAAFRCGALRTDSSAGAARRGVFKTPQAIHAALTAQQRSPLCFCEKCKQDRRIAL